MVRCSTCLYWSCSSDEKNTLMIITITKIFFFSFLQQTIDPTDNKFACFAASSWAHVTHFTLLRWATPNLQYLRDIKIWNQLVQVHKESFGKFSSKLNQFRRFIHFVLYYGNGIFIYLRCLYFTSERKNKFF